MEAAMSLRAEFFAPLILTFPERVLPPLIYISGHYNIIFFRVLIPAYTNIYLFCITYKFYYAGFKPGTYQYLPGTTSGLTARSTESMMNMPHPQILRG